MALQPRWAPRQFDTFDRWVNNASRFLEPRKGTIGEDVRAICVDALGRRCHVGSDFMRARDEQTFPVRFFWDCEVVADTPEDDGPTTQEDLVIDAYYWIRRCGDWEPACWAGGEWHVIGWANFIPHEHIRAVGARISEREGS